VLEELDAALDVEGLDAVARARVGARRPLEILRPAAATCGAEEVQVTVRSVL
jgi:hypothetical protein